MAKLPAFLTRRLLAALNRHVAMRRAPDKIIGGAENPYIYRWHVIPRNRWFNLYFHNQVRPDDDRALHDHPWPNISIVLEGGYLEQRPAFPKEWPHNRKTEIVDRPAGSIVARRAGAAHRLELLEDRFGLKHGQPSRLRPSWSLFITGPVLRPWGFWCPQGWVWWQDFTDPSGLRPGKGCGEEEAAAPSPSSPSGLTRGSMQTEATDHNARVTELLEANNREVELRREAANDVRTLLANIDSLTDQVSLGDGLGDEDLATLDDIRRQYGSA